jgi:hypothetical protein
MEILDHPGWLWGHVWTAPGWQGESSLCGVGRSGHVFGLFARYS